jgi:hypothetical protein
MDNADYNYAHFDEHIAEGADQTTFESFRHVMSVGQRGVDVEVTRLDDEAPVRLSELWRTRPLVVEFGSFT